MCPSASSGAITSPTLCGAFTPPTLCPDNTAVVSLEATQQPVLVADATIGPHTVTSGLSNLVNKDGAPALAPILGAEESTVPPRDPPPLPAAQQAKECPAAQQADLTSAARQSQLGVTDPHIKGEQRETAAASIEDQMEEMRTSLKNINATLALLARERVERHKGAKDDDDLVVASRNAETAAPQSPPNQEDDDEDAEMDDDDQKICIYSNAISTLKLMDTPKTSLQAEVLVEFLKEHQVLKDELAKSRRFQAAAEPVRASAEEIMASSMIPALQQAEAAPKSAHLSAGPGGDRVHESLPKMTAIKAESPCTASHFARAAAMETDLPMAGDDIGVLTKEETRRLRKFTEPAMEEFPTLKLGSPLLQNKTKEETIDLTDQAVRWLAQMEKSARTNRVRCDILLMKLGTVYLADDARKWYSSLLPEPRSWDDFVRAFKLAYIPSNYVDLVASELRECTARCGLFYNFSSFLEEWKKRYQRLVASKPDQEVLQTFNIASFVKQNIALWPIGQQLAIKSLMSESSGDDLDRLMIAVLRLRQSDSFASAMDPVFLYAREAAARMPARAALAGVSRMVNDTGPRDTRIPESHADALAIQRTQPQPRTQADNKGGKPRKCHICGREGHWATICGLNPRHLSWSEYQIQVLGQKPKEDNGRNDQKHSGGGQANPNKGNGGGKKGGGKWNRHRRTDDRGRDRNNDRPNDRGLEDLLRGLLAARPSEPTHQKTETNAVSSQPAKTDTSPNVLVTSGSESKTPPRTEQTAHGPAMQAPFTNGSARYNAVTVTVGAALAGSQGSEVLQPLLAQTPFSVPENASLDADSVLDDECDAFTRRCNAVLADLSPPPLRVVASSVASKNVQIPLENHH